MTIGIDLSPIQGPHRMRGIGYTLINLMNSVPASYKKHKFVFFVLEQSDAEFGDPLEILDLKDLDYEVRKIKPRLRSQKQLPGRLNLLVSTYNALRELWDLKFGDPRIKDLKDVDVFLQTDQAQSLPRKRGLKKLLVVYDIIPYVLEWDYLWTYKTAREIYGYSRKAAIRCSARRYLYALKLRLNSSRSDVLLAISETTKHDLISNFRIKKQKIAVTPLGTIIPQVHSKKISLQKFEKTSWGYRPDHFTFDSDLPYILFVGGADKRRKLQDLVSAFNNLRAQGIELKLVLAGDSMQGPEAIATEEIQAALKTSSYLDDIIFLGFVDDFTRDWLYKHALAYVFPSRYEGFGLPVLEAFTYSCPVICYKNSAVHEVANDAPLYVQNSQEIESKIKYLLSADSKDLAKITNRGSAQAAKFNWTKTSGKIFDIVSKGKY